MLNKYSATVYRRDEDFEVAVEAMSHLRKQFLTMPFETFVNVEELRRTLPEKKEVSKHLLYLGTYLDFGTDSYRYFMRYLEDAKTAKVVEADADHDIHTDMWGRISHRKAKQALGFAMGFQRFSEELNVEELGFESDPGYAEETVSTELGDVQISGLKNTNGNFHGYCEILQSDGAVQSCFFNDGKILARRICYANGMCEDVKGDHGLAVDPYAPRTVYELCITEDVAEDDNTAFGDKEHVIKEVTADRETVKEIFNTFGNYSLHAEYRHYVSYPYCDEDVLETENSERTPTVNMALIFEGKLAGVLFKSNGKSIAAPDCERCLNWGWDTFTVPLDEEIVKGQFTFTLRKKDEKGDSENEA